MGTALVDVYQIKTRPVNAQTLITYRYTVNFPDNPPGKHILIINPDLRVDLGYEVMWSDTTAGIPVGRAEISQEVVDAAVKYADAKNEMLKLFRLLRKNPPTINPS